jgi:hypothetical protein
MKIHRGVRIGKTWFVYCVERQEDSTMPENWFEGRTEIHFVCDYQLCAGILEQSLGAGNRVGIGFSGGSPGYIDWRNRFLEIDA